MLTKKQLKIIEELKTAALESELHSRHGAGIIKNGRLSFVSCNNSRTMLNRTVVPSVHAEIYCMYQALKTGGCEGCDLWVVRATRDGQLKNSKPCKSCFLALQKYGIRRVYYSTESGDIACLYVKDHDDYPEGYISKAQRMFGSPEKWFLEI